MSTHNICFVLFCGEMLCKKNISNCWLKTPYLVYMYATRRPNSDSADVQFNQVRHFSLALVHIVEFIFLSIK